MNRIAVFSAALVLAASAGLAQAQVSNDDFSSLTGPNANHVASTAPIARPSAAQVLSNVDLEQGIVGPQAAHAVAQTTRAQVIRDREQARAQGALVPGAEYMNTVAAPGPVRIAGSIATPAGQ